MKTEINKFIKYSIGFCLFMFTTLYIIEESISYLVTKSNNSQTGKVNLVMSHIIDPNVLIIGSSVSEVGFNIDVLEKKLQTKAYNLAIDGTPILKSEFLIDEFLTYTKNCDTIIIGLASFSLSNTGDIHSPERFLAHKSNKFVKHNIKKLYPKLHTKIAYIPFYSFVLANHTYYKNAIVGLKNILSSNDMIKSDSLKGFVPHNATYLNTHYKNDDLIKLYFSEESITQFKDILVKIKNHNITPILVITPMHKNGQNAFENYSDYPDLVNLIANETNTQILDFSNSEITQYEDYFYNNGHLNVTGALKFSTSLSDSLLQQKARSHNTVYSK